MSSSSSSRFGAPESVDLRYNGKVCSCGQKTLIKIVESEVKPSRGRLYFVCPAATCGFQGWCIPYAINGNPTATTTSRAGDGFEQMVVAIKTRVEVVEAKQEMVKQMVVGCLFVFFISVAILVCKL
ncbi:hypothetical protein ACP275_03G036100 [Erythranthe tilingii]